MKKLAMSMMVLVGLFICNSVIAATITVPDDQPTIQAAIDNSNDGDEIVVKEGTYNENIEFNSTFTTQNLTISGVKKNRPIVTGGVRFTNTADIDGLTIQNLYIKGQNPSGNGVFDMDNLGNVTNLTLNKCVIDGEYVSNRHGFLGQNLGGNLTITNNEFKDIMGWSLLDSESGSGGDGALHFDTITFSCNYIHDSNGSVAFRGLSIDRTDLVNAFCNRWDSIGGNGGETGFQWAALEVNRAETVNIQNNTVNDVELGGGGEGQAFQLWDIDTIDVSANTITNGAQGIFIYVDAGGGLGGPFAIPAGSISKNCFSNMSEYGLSVDSGATGGSLDAENNWWGDASGPFHATLNPSGTGEVVIGDVGDVDFDPWLTKNEIQKDDCLICDDDKKKKKKRKKK